MTKNKNIQKYFKTPILFLIFNRLDTTKKVFQEIKKVRPKKLFIAADGPRNKEEKKKTDKVREYVLDNINWKCDVHKLFRKNNLGCKKAVSSAINWFFKSVDKGIILEDDCLPNPDFFKFCQKLLNKYEEDERIMAISGTNTHSEKNPEKSYHFSNICHPWGWATWRRAWKYYDKNLSTLNKFEKLGGYREFFPEKYMQVYNKDILHKVKKGKINSWAYVWGYSIWSQNGLTCRPNRNLISNIGFGEKGTNTKVETKFASLKSQKMTFPLKHPLIKIADRTKDKKYYEMRRVYPIQRIFMPLFRKMKIYNKLKSFYFKLK